MAIFKRVAFGATIYGFVFGAVLLVTPQTTLAACQTDLFNQCIQSFTRGIPETFGYRGPDAEFGSSNDDKATGVFGRARECIDCAFERMRTPSQYQRQNSAPRYYTPMRGGASR